MSSERNTRRRFRVDDLFADTSPRAAGVNDLVEAKSIQIGRIEPDPTQPRRAFDDEALAELAASIRAEGILQPIAVRYDDARDVYIILHGERRWRAARLAGLAELPAIVREVPAERRLLQQLMENIVREDLNALDRAAALRALKVQMGDAPWEQVAAAVGIRRSRLFQLLGTEKLSPTLQQALRESVVSEKQTRAVQSLPEPVQEEIGAALLSGALEPAQLEQAGRTLRGAESAAEVHAALASMDAAPQAEASINVRDLRRRTAALSDLLRGVERHNGRAAALPDELRADLEHLHRLIEQLLAR
jgi:ParB family chromosome partitioning protein